MSRCIICLGKDISDPSRQNVCNTCRIGPMCSDCYAYHLKKYHDGDNICDHSAANYQYGEQPSADKVYYSGDNDIPNFYQGPVITSEEDYDEMWRLFIKERLNRELWKKRC